MTVVKLDCDHERKGVRTVLKRITTEGITAMRRIMTLETAMKRAIATGEVDHHGHEAGYYGRPSGL